MRRHLPVPSPLRLLVACLVLCGCETPELAELRKENEQLRQELEAARKPADTTAPALDFAPIRQFTLGVAAAEEEGFESGAFLEFLRESLAAGASEEEQFSVESVGEAAETAKVRAMLVRELLGESDIPIRLTNISFRLPDRDADLEIGGALVPRDGRSVEATGEGSAVRGTHEGPVFAEMRRDAAGEYSVSWEISGGRTGRIPLRVAEQEILESAGTPRAARHGDIAFNWQLSVREVRVYRVRGYAGDVGRFLQAMRYPRIESGVNRYQTLEDSVFLLGYGPYATGLQNRLSTPGFIDRVDLLPVDAATFESLEPGMERDELRETLSAAEGDWQQCAKVGLSGDETLWERPVAVSFPFVSRQTSGSEGTVFFAKYGVDGRSVLLGDYPLSER